MSSKKKTKVEDYKERQRKKREERRNAANVGLEIPEGWQPESFTEADNPHGRLFGKSEFSVKFPKYREKYIRENWPLIKAMLKNERLAADLDVLEGSLSVATTSKTFDPYSIIKGRDLLRLLSRSVPLEQARRVLEDGVYCEVIPISLPNRERFIRRRNRLIGPDGATLKALELLTDCYVLVTGKTVAAVGKYAGVVEVKNIVDAAFRENVHPFSSIKRLMVLKRLKGMEELKGQDWMRFLPKTKKKNLSRRKKPRKVTKKGEYTPFPPEQTPRKEDIEMAEGVFFMKEAERKKRREEKKAEKSKEVAQKKKKERAAAFVAPPEVSTSKKRKAEEDEETKLKEDIKKMKRLKRQ